MFIVLKCSGEKLELQNAIKALSCGIEKDLLDYELLTLMLSTVHKPERLMQTAKSEEWFAF